jgi:Flp pilus assembly protein TadG
MPSSRSSDDSGQAAVEVVLATPIVLLLLFAAVQVAVVIGDQLALESVARNTARALALGEPVPVDNRLRPARLSAANVVQDGTVTVTVRYQSPTEVPFVGRLLGNIDLQADATMLIEPSPP